MNPHPLPRWRETAEAPGLADRGFRHAGVYAVVMLDETVEGYPVSFRALALVGLLFVGALAFILLDVASDGKLSGGCKDCGDKAAAGA